MSLFGSMFYGASSASLWTGNMIYTALQNAKTKREVRELYNRASEANFKNRSVAILPSINKQQLLLTTGDPSENDIYDYQSNSNTAALDYIWGESDDPEGIIVSGGQPIDRVCSLIPFVHKAQANVINNLESVFSDVCYFPMSAIGHSPEPGVAFEPFGIIDSVAWIAKKRQSAVYPTLKYVQEKINRCDSAEQG